MVTIGLIGVSGFAEVHYNDLLRQAGAGQIRWACATVVNQSEEAGKCEVLRQLGVEVFDDYERMLAAWAGRLDLCVIPTGIHLHKPMTVAALRSGANVLVEKPAAATIQDVRAMQAVERETGKFVAVGFQTMYASDTLAMKRVILDGEIGRVRVIKSIGKWPRFDSYYSRNPWAGSLRHRGHWVLDSPINNAMAHQLNMICYLAGSDLSRSADLVEIEAELYRAHEIESADTACLRMTTTSGLPLYFFASHATDGFKNPEIVVSGDQGRIYWTFDTLIIERVGQEREVIRCDSGNSLRDRMFAQVFRRISDPSVTICDLEIASRHTLAVNGAHESSPVVAIGAGFVRREPTPDSMKTSVSGIDALMDRAFAEERLFSSLGAPWTRPGRRFSLRDYSRFGGEDANNLGFAVPGAKVCKPLVVSA